MVSWRSSSASWRSGRRRADVNRPVCGPDPATGSSKAGSMGTRECSGRCGKSRLWAYTDGQSVANQRRIAAKLACPGQPKRRSAVAKSHYAGRVGSSYNRSPARAMRQAALPASARISPQPTSSGSSPCSERSGQAGRQGQDGAAATCARCRAGPCDHADASRADLLARCRRHQAGSRRLSGRCLGLHQTARGGPSAVAAALSGRRRMRAVLLPETRACDIQSGRICAFATARTN